MPYYYDYIVPRGAIPYITAVMPASGSTAGGTPISITGPGTFEPAAVVRIDGALCTAVVVVNPGLITCVTPPGPLGLANVVVYNPSQTSSGGSGYGLFTYTSAPSIVSIAPNSGYFFGGTDITDLHGVNFVVGATVTIGGAPATSVIVVSSTKITCIAPAGTVGAQNVVVTNPDLQNSGASGNGLYTYLVWLPTMLAGLEYWIDAAAYTPGAWPDQSGVGDAGRNASQAVALQQPTLNAMDAAYNNQPTVSFLAAVDQFLTTGVWSAPLAQPCTVIVIGNNDGSAVDQFYFDGIDGVNRLVIDKPNATNYEVFAGVGFTPSIRPPDAPVGYVMADPSVLLAEFNGANSVLYLSSQVSLNSLQFPIPHFPLQVGDVGTNQALGLTIGAAVNTSLPLNGKIREMFIYNRMLSTAERNQVLGYAGASNAIFVSDVFALFDGNANMFGQGTSSPGGVTALPTITPNHTPYRTAGWYNQGKGGETTPQLTALLPTTLGFFDSRATGRTLALLEIQNDLTVNGGSVNPLDTSYAATAWANLIAYSAAARAAGVTRLVLCTCLPEGAASGAPANYEALRQAVNTLIRANYVAYFDAIADIGAPGSPIGSLASTATPLYAADNKLLSDTGTVQAAIILGAVL